MFINTWSERSSFLADLIIETVNNYTTKNNIEYNAFYTFSGFNDRVIIAPTLKDLPDYFMISFIIGWAYADAELAVVHRFDNDTQYEYVTDKYLEFDNTTVELLDGRQTDYLLENKIKYYSCPFDEKHEEIIKDILACIDKLPTFNSV
jgi:hypothetical protein